MNVRARWSGPLIWHFRAFKVKSHFLPSSVIIHLSACLYVGVSVLQVCRCEVSNQLRAGAGKKKKKKPNLQPLQQETLYICLSSPPAELLFSLSPSFFSLKRSSSRSFSQRKRDTLEMRWRGERAQCSSKYVLSALCIISTTTFTSGSTHLSE